MSDLIDRQAAIEAVMECYDNDELFEVYEDKLRELPPAQPEQTEMIKEIRKWINSANRGNADYFIVDKIEEIINRYE